MATSSSSTTQQQQHQQQTTPYLDLTPLLSPTFTPASHANTLLHQTNNPSDTPLDLSTPLQKILFDVQEISTLIDSLTTSSALPLISHTESQTLAAGNVLQHVEERVEGLQEVYARLEREVGERWAVAEQVRLVAERMVRTLRLGRGVQRVVGLGRQLEAEIQDAGGAGGGERAATTILHIKEMFRTTEGLERVHIASAVRGEILVPAERGLISKAQNGIREFGVWERGFVAGEEMRGRVKGWVGVLYLLSPVGPVPAAMKGKGTGTFEPGLVVQALQAYLQSNLSASLMGLGRGLAALPTLERVLLEVSGRCGNLIALEGVLETLRLPPHPLLLPSLDDAQSQHTPPPNLLHVLLRAMDEEGSSLPSFYWRSLAAGLEGKVREILNKGGVSARTLRSSRERVREMVRECVERGYTQGGGGTGGGTGGSGGGGGRKVGGEGNRGKWEREAAVMVGSVVGPLGR